MKMTITFSYKTQEEKNILQDIIRQEAGNRFKSDYHCVVSPKKKIYVYVNNDAYYKDIRDAKQQMYIRELLNSGLQIKKYKYELNSFLCQVLNKVNFDTEVDERL